MDSIATRTLGFPGHGADMAAMATAAPILNQRQLRLGRRQDDENWNTCAVIDLLDGQMDIPCAGECVTTGDFYGCEDYFVTTCYDNDSSECDGDGQYGCCGRSYPWCATIYKTEDDESYTQFECFSELSGEYTAEQADATVTDSITLTGSILVQESSTRDSDNEPTGDGSGDDEHSGSDGGGEAPLGAIIGGAIGGVALLALAGFGFWYMRLQKRKAADKATAAAVAGSGISSGVGTPYNMAQSPYTAGYPSPGYYDNPLQMQQYQQVGSPSELPNSESPFLGPKDHQHQPPAELQ